MTVHNVQLVAEWLRAHPLPADVEVIADRDGATIKVYPASPFTMGLALAETFVLFPPSLEVVRHNTPQEYLLHVSLQARRN